MFHRVGGWTARHPWLVLAMWLAVGIGLACTAPSWDKSAQDDDIHFLPERCASVQGYRLLQAAFPQDVYASKLIFALQRPDGPLSEADLALCDALVVQLNRLRQDEPHLQIKKIVSLRDPLLGSRLISSDKRCALIQVSLGSPYLALKTRDAVDRADQVVRAFLDTLPSADLPILYTTGPAGVGRDLLRAGGASLDGTTLATVLLVIVILLGVYRSPLLTLIPLTSIALAVWIALNILAMCTYLPGFYLVNISAIFAIVMLYGAGTDYCLFLISRYREELAAGKTGLEALSDSVAGVGEAITASAATTICGLGLMALAEFAKVRCGGPAIAVSLAVALLASLTLTPALLALVGRYAFWPVGVPTLARTQAESEGLWGWLSHVVVRRPLLIGIGSFLLLVPLAMLGLTVKPSYRATAELSPHSSSVRGLEAIARHFTPGELGPITLLLEADQSWDSPTGKQVIDHLSVGFGLLPNVAEVRSLTRPLGQPLTPMLEAPVGKAGLFAQLVSKVSANLEERIQAATRAHYLARNGEKHVTRLDVVLRTDPFDPRSAETLEVIQLWAADAVPLIAQGMSNLRTATYGITVSSKDMAVVTESDRSRINSLVVVGVLVILFVLVRHLGLALYLLATVLLSYLATLGATILLAYLLHGRSFGEVDWRVPFFLFTILVAVGADYNIFLLSRALEEKKRHGGREGLRRGLAHTGGTITSCGLIMAGTFATLLLAGLNTLVQVGFALAFGVLLDTFLVRPFLVPAFTLWLWNEDQPTQQPTPPATPTALDEPEVVPIYYRRAG